MSGARRITDCLSPAEIRELTTSDVHGFAALLTTWMMIAASFAPVAWHPGALTVSVALIVGAYLTTFSLFVRIRAIAEHACTERSSDPFANTRTTRAGLLAKLTVAPHNVNFHLEHHLLPTVPQHSLARMHRLLLERAALDPRNGALSYLDTLRLVTRQSDP